MTDSSIRIEVETAYLDQQSDPGEGRYAFAYSITISNDGLIAARLLSRHWIITCDQGNREFRKGLGSCQRFQSLADVAEIMLDPKLAHPQ